MNTEKFIHSGVVDTDSPGFSVQETSEMLLKKFFWKASTGSRTQIYNEPPYTPTVYPSQVIGQTLPESPPNDFVTLTDLEIKTVFGITDSDIQSFTTKQNGSSVFSIQQSVLYPYIYKVNNCRLVPWTSNPDLTFSAIGSESGINLLEKTISFNLFNTNAWKGTFKRTSSNQELSQNGYDTITESQLSYIYDSDSGIFTSYEVERKKYTPNPLSSQTPPSATCYIYRGYFGNYASNNSTSELWVQSSNYIYSPGRVVIGKSDLSCEDNNLEVSGIANIGNIVTGSLETYSDRRLKENIIEQKPNYKILELNTYKYNYISKFGETEIGVIAQETEKIVPEIVKDHGGYKTVLYDRIGVLLLPIVKDLTEKIARLEEDNEEIKLSLKAIISSLSAEMIKNKCC